MGYKGGMRDQGFGYLAGFQFVRIDNGKDVKQGANEVSAMMRYMENTSGVEASHKPQTLNPKPQTLNPKSKTVNPKP